MKNLPMLQIRKAEKKDAKQVYELANSLKIDFDNPREGGFLVYVLTKEEYLRRIESSNYFYVLEKGKQMVGFLMCYDNLTLKELVEEGIIKNKIAGYVSKQEKPFIFGDQIGINNENSSKGFGKILMGKLFSDMKKNSVFNMYVAILHKPVKNKVSFNFCKALGFEQISELKNNDSLVWQIYKLELNKK